MFNYKIDNFIVIEFTPQLDVEMPSLRIEEAPCNLESKGVVYDITIIPNAEDPFTTTLTEEELVLVKNHIEYLLEKRQKDPNRRNLLRK